MFGTSEPKVPVLDPSTQSWVRGKMKSIQTERLRSEVERLLGPHNRLHSPGPMNQIESVLFQDLRTAGLAVEKRPFHLKDVHGAWDFGDGLPTVFPELEGANLIGVKEGTELPRDALVVVAHYDTRRDTPGADDNTASVVGMLELARLLAGERFRKTIIFAATDMEELLYVGARSLVEELSRKYRIRGAIVLETLAYVDQKPHTMKLESKPGILYRTQWKRMERHDWTAMFTLVLYQKSASRLAADLAAGLRLTAGPESFVLARDPGDLPAIGLLLRRLAPGLVRQFHRSDHVPFWEAGIPAVQVTDGADFSNPNYHGTTDLPATLDYPRLGAIVGAVASTLAVQAGLEQNAPA